MNSNNPNNEDQWLPCEEGAIVEASASIRNRKKQQSRRQFLRAAATASVVVAGAGFAGWSLFGQKDELNALTGNPNYPGGIACSEVQRRMAEYIGNKINNVELRESIEVHLAKCGHCCDIHDAEVAKARIA